MFATVSSIVRTSLDALAMYGATFNTLRSSVDLETFLVFIRYIIDAFTGNLLGLVCLAARRTKISLTAGPRLAITQNDNPEKIEKH